MSELRSNIQALREILSGDIDKRVLLTVHQQIKTRIFVDGEDASENPIGNYSKPYIKRRVKKGLGGSPKVVLEFTGQMKNDFQLIEEGGSLGSGFLNSANGDKSEWVEDTYNKEIFKASKDEEDLIEELINSEVNRLLNG